MKQTGSIGLKFDRYSLTQKKPEVRLLFLHPLLKRVFVVLLAVSFSSTVFAAPKPLCSGNLCLTYTGSVLTFSGADGTVIKEVELTSSVQSVFFTGKRFYIVTEGYLYSVDSTGNLTGKLQLLFTPRLVQQIGSTLLVVRDDTLKFKLREDAQGLRLEQIKTPLQEQEHFIAQQADGQSVFFYPQRIVYGDQGVKPIVLLASDKERVCYVDEKKQVICKDINFKTVQYSSFPFPSIVNFQGFAQGLAAMDRQSLDTFIESIGDRSLKDQVLSAYITSLLTPDRVSRKTLNFSLQNLQSIPGAGLASIAFVKAFALLDDKWQRSCLDAIKDQQLREDVLTVYADKLLVAYRLAQYDYLFSFLPGSDSLNNSVLTPLAHVFMQRPANDRKHILSGIIRSGLIGPFMYKLVSTLPSPEDRGFEFAEPYYAHLSEDEKNEILALVIYKFGESLNQLTVKGESSITEKSLQQQAGKLLNSAAFRRIVAVRPLELEYDISSREQGTSSSISIVLRLDKDIVLLDLSVNGICNVIKSYEQKGSYSETILLFVPVATVEALYQVDEYACRIDTKTVQKITMLNTMFADSGVHVANANQIREEWAFTNKELLEKLSITPNFIGESLIEEANAPPECKALRSSCLARCFENSRCESYCYEAFYHCTKAK